MRILQVITSLQIGGAEHVVVYLSKLLSQKGYTVDVVVFNSEETAFMRDLEEAGCRIYKLGHGVYNIEYISKLRKIMREYDIIHTHNSSPQLFAAIANIGLGKVLITTEHSTNNRKREHPMFSFVDKWMYGKYAKVVTISKIAEEKLCSYLGLEDNHTNCALHSRIMTINNGVDVNAFYHAENLPELAHRGKFVTVMVAAFREAKDQDTVIRAIALLPDEYELWLVGDGVRRPEIEAEIFKQHVTERVKLLGIRSDVPQILKSADVIVMSSHWEGLSLSNIEGMSAGKPFIASNVNGLREVTEGWGLLFEHEDDEQLARLINKLANDEAYYKQVAVRCFERARQFDISQTVRLYADVYQNVSSLRH